MPFVTLGVDAAGFVRENGLDAVLRSMDRVNMGGGIAAARVIRNHIRNLAATRHGTAGRLGASPTNHFKASDVASPVADGEGVSIAVSTPGIGRAYGDVVIRPVEARALAIPMDASAYGFQPRELTDRGEILFRMLLRGERRGGRRSNVLFKAGEDGSPVAMYALVGEVTQPRDPSLMPTDDELLRAFADGATAAAKAAASLPK